MESGRVISEKNVIRIANPFTLKVGKVFTGFRIGGGRSLNLGAIPMMNQVMSATRDATDAFSSVSRHVNISLRKLGAKNIEVGTGCRVDATPMLDQVMSITKGATDAFSGVSNSIRKLGTSSIPSMVVGYGIGFSHGLGLGVSIRSGVNQFQSSIAEPMTMMIGLIPGLPFGQGALPMPTSSKSAEGKVPTDQISAESMMQLATKSANKLSQDLVGSQPTKIDSVFDNKVLKRIAVDSASDSQTQKVMKQQKIIEELAEENENLRQILQVKDLKILSTKVQACSSGTSPISKGENEGKKE